MLQVDTVMFSMFSKDKEVAAHLYSLPESGKTFLANLTCPLSKAVSTFYKCSSCSLNAIWPSESAFQAGVEKGFKTNLLSPVSKEVPENLSQAL